MNVRCFFCLLFLLPVFSLKAQSSSVACHEVDNFVDHVSSTYYWGSPPWQKKLDSALQICPTSARAWGNRGMIHLMRGDVATWSSYIEKAIQHNALYFLGIRAWHRMRYLRDYEGALRDLKKQDSIANFNPIYVLDVHNNMLMGQCEEGMGHFDAALDYYNRSLAKQRETRGETWIGTYDLLIRGILKYKMKDYAGALTDLDKQAKSNELLADTYYYRALIYKSWGQQDKSRAELEQCKMLMEGKGFHRWDPQVIMMNEIWLSDVEEQLTSLR